MRPVDLRKDYEKIKDQGRKNRLLLNKTQINFVVRLFANIIYNKYTEDSSQKEILSFSLLEGGKYFGNDLASEIEKLGAPIYNKEVKVTSYKDNHNPGNFELNDNFGNIEGKDILVFDDLIDTGNTLERLTAYLHDEKKVKSVSYYLLLDKMDARKEGFSIPYTSGFIVPDRWVFGYGMDDHGKNRELKDIYIKSG